MLLDLAMDSSIWHQERRSQEKIQVKTWLDQTQNVCPSKNIVKETERNLHGGRKHFQNLHLI